MWREVKIWHEFFHKVLQNGLNIIVMLIHTHTNPKVRTFSSDGILNSTVNAFAQSIVLAVTGDGEKRLKNVHSIKLGFCLGRLKDRSVLTHILQCHTVARHISIDAYVCNCLLLMLFIDSDNTGAA